MYCPSCGKEVNSGLTFCNYCGVRLAPAESDPSALSVSSFNLLIGAMIAIPVVGLGLIIALMAVMKKGLEFRDDMIFVVIFMTFLLLFFAELGTILMLISKSRKPKVKPIKKKDEISSPPVSAIDEVVIKGLNPTSFEGVPSVTEHTTRTLDAVYRKQTDE
jgi:hypothetical protein